MAQTNRTVPHGATRRSVRQQFLTLKQPGSLPAERQAPPLTRIERGLHALAQEVRAHRLAEAES